MPKKIAAKKDATIPPTTRAQNSASTIQPSETAAKSPENPSSTSKTKHSRHPCVYIERMTGMVRTAVTMPLLVLLSSWHSVAGPQTAQLLSEAENQASLLKSDLATIEFFGLSASSWQTHSAIVTAYREHINALRNQAGKLEAARSDGSPSQKVAIDRVIPLLREFAAAADAALAAIARNPDRLNSSDYKQFIKLNSDLAGEFSTLIGTWADFGKTSEELAGVAKKIDAPAPQLR